MSDEFYIEHDSPLSDLRPGRTFNERAVLWLDAAHELVSHKIAWDRNHHGHGEEVSPLFTNRQADHLAMGLTILASHFRRLSSP